MKGETENQKSNVFENGTLTPKKKEKEINILVINTVF
jgi:hypothetical protein